MNLVQSSAGLVVTVGEKKSHAKSPQLKKALLDGDHIVTCTLQTFPEVMKLIEDTDELRGRRWAVVADEAHSSQSGTAARKLKELRVDVEVDEGEEISADDLLAAKDSAIAASANITFIALTATPKAKTLRLFGTERDGRWEAFDTYTMAQAMEEGFILDVLTNYSTYDMLLRVKNTLESGDEETEIQVNTGEAVSNIVRYARLHPDGNRTGSALGRPRSRRTASCHRGGSVTATSDRLTSARLPGRSKISASPWWTRPTCSTLDCRWSSKCSTSTTARAVPSEPHSRHQHPHRVGAAIPARHLPGHVEAYRVCRRSR